MKKRRTVTNIDKANERYLKFCEGHYQFKNGTRKTQSINKDYSYHDKKNGYWVLRYNMGWVFAFVESYSGKVFINQ